ncbi:hypothetical protein [Vibrio splendidus]|uniref:hypothetical protein n=1 Tax=Vibrio splendidus TaxID=29497 RepID=UPI000D35BDF9|nr:hypothetical protein [Vibrio splendidus]PTP53470.1 hypothetical protein CWN83_11890 [Vibrio splendidus]
MRCFYKKLSIDIGLSSTKKGLALLGAGAALVAGHPELLTASVSETGVQYGGLLGTLVPLAIGLWETLRNESEGQG